MRNLTLNDPTQMEILRHLAVTERMLATVASKLSGVEQGSQIWAMPDLGLPYNTVRIAGGFFTGALYSWQTSVPFVPVDATVNSCGVAVFRLTSCIEDPRRFQEMIEQGRDRADREGVYQWNFGEGNHFVTYGVVSGSDIVPDGAYLVLHASGRESKHQYHGLYPTESNWYAGDIHIELDTSGRYLRYICGSTADRFFQEARRLQVEGRNRLRYFADLIAGGNQIVEEVLNVMHYGMPTASSVAIGCQWKSQPYLLLTAPQQDLFFVKPRPALDNHAVVGSKELVLSPHGLGVEVPSYLTLDQGPGSVSINGHEYRVGDSLRNMPQLTVRGYGATRDILDGLLHAILERCPGEVIGRLQPVYSYDGLAPNVQTSGCTGRS